MGLAGGTEEPSSARGSLDCVRFKARSFAWTRRAFATSEDFRNSAALSVKLTAVVRVTYANVAFQRCQLHFLLRPTLQVKRPVRSALDPLITQVSPNHPYVFRIVIHSNGRTFVAAATHLSRPVVETTNFSPHPRLNFRRALRRARKRHQIKGLIARHGTMIPRTRGLDARGVLVRGRTV